MEPPTGILASLLQFILFIPYFTGLLLLGVIKGIVFCPVICHIVEEKRKVNPKNAEEKKRNDQEKAILKQFIGSKTIPTL